MQQTHPKSRRRLPLYVALVRRWQRMLSGRSYWHTPQRPGKRFVPGQIAGYFKDYTSKTDWFGEVDPGGVPLLETHDGRKVAFPTTAFQKALGHWERWLAEDRAEGPHAREFRRLCDWARASQDERGGWSIGPAAAESISPYSAMTQGQGVSVLLREFQALGDRASLDAARRAFELMRLPVDEGGVARQGSGGLILEEYPRSVPRTVLNGWIYALFGIYELGLADPGRSEVDEALAATLTALAARVPDYDAGYWSYYDDAGALASPDYHDLHILQLVALERTFPELAKSLAPTRETFVAYRESRVNRGRALVVKSWQKLRHPAHVVFR